MEQNPHYKSMRDLHTDAIRLVGLLTTLAFMHKEASSKDSQAQGAIVALADKALEKADRCLRALTS